MQSQVICPYCRNNAILVNGCAARKLEHNRVIWLCQPCDAYVRCHPQSKKHKPLGTLANQELRCWRIETHKFFDAAWRLDIRVENISVQLARNNMYAWLANKLGISIKECHIAKFDIETCQDVIGLLSSNYKK